MNSSPFDRFDDPVGPERDVVKEVPADPAGAAEFLIGLVLGKRKGDLQSPPAFIIGEPVGTFPEEPPEAVVAGLAIGKDCFYLFVYVHPQFLRSSSLWSTVIV